MVYLEKAHNTPTCEFRVNGSSLRPCKQQSASLFQGVLPTRGKARPHPHPHPHLTPNSSVSLFHAGVFRLKRRMLQLRQQSMITAAAQDSKHSETNTQKQTLRDKGPSTKPSAQPSENSTTPKHSEIKGRAQSPQPSPQKTAQPQSTQR